MLVPRFANGETIVVVLEKAIWPLSHLSCLGFAFKVGDFLENEKDTVKKTGLRVFSRFLGNDVMYVRNDESTSVSQSRYE